MKKAFKCFVKNILMLCDSSIAYAIILFCSSSQKEKKTMIMPADSISGGFGEDIMVAGLLNSLDCPVAIFASVIEPRFFLGKDVMKVEYGKGYFVYTMFAWLMRKYSDVISYGRNSLKKYWLISLPVMTLYTLVQGLRF